ncbi:MAG: hypothetical protein J6R27_05530 [Muribaculaceae bacterium]|nr:hypothetical protein [Muribaculaceae bacterium]
MPPKPPIPPRQPSAIALASAAFANAPVRSIGFLADLSLLSSRISPPLLLRQSAATQRLNGNRGREPLGVAEQWLCHIQAPPTIFALRSCAFTKKSAPILSICANQRFL